MVGTTVAKPAPRVTVATVAVVTKVVLAKSADDDRASLGR